jgi:hypothetical protein
LPDLERSQLAPALGPFLLLISLQFPLSPMVLFGVGVELSNFAVVQRLQHPYVGMHGPRSSAAISTASAAVCQCFFACSALGRFMM